jgi:glycerol-1-phosphate dehydrogenase [NAD(P)+]
MDVKKLNEKFDNCSCKKEHKCDIEFVKVERGAVNSLKDLIKDYKKVVLVYDENTYNLLGKKIEGILNNIEKLVILKPQEKVVIPNEEKIDEITNSLSTDTDLIIGVGSGVVNDLCKHVSFTKNLPYFIVATAPSMDGYASVGSALILKGMKITLNARPPKAIIADTSVLKDAPIEMIKAGYGDIVGKFSCLNDWLLSAFINKEYFCKKIYDYTYNCAKKVK